ncbi:MAG: hypothetical protein JNL32_03400 [Candidatus Kapabacteria bacterium]|nr:hypothetical protein [Candidatus Kapabacteria bacterium]
MTHHVQHNTLRRSVVAAYAVIAVFTLVLLQSCSSMNGSYIEPPNGPRGLCSLYVTNNFDDDMVVKLFDVKNPKVCLHYVYVSRKNTALIEGIAPGNIIMKYSKGKEWNNATRMFTRDRANFETDQVLKFEESETKTETSDGIRTQKQWSVNNFTFNANAGEGNATTSQIDDKEFNENK